MPGHRPPYPPPETGRVPNTKHTFQMDTLMEAMQWGFQKSHFEASQTPGNLSRITKHKKEHQFEANVSDNLQPCPRHGNIP